MDVVKLVSGSFAPMPRSALRELQAKGPRDPETEIRLTARLLSAGVDRITIESQGITEKVSSQRTDVPAKIAGSLGLDRVIFEAACSARTQCRDGVGRESSRKTTQTFDGCNVSELDDRRFSGYLVVSSCKKNYYRS